MFIGLSKWEFKSCLPQARAVSSPVWKYQLVRTPPGPACSHSLSAKTFHSEGTSLAGWNSSFYNAGGQRCQTRSEFHLQIHLHGEEFDDWLTYFSWESWRSCSTFAYFLLALSTLLLSWGALEQVGFDTKKLFASCTLDVFSGSILLTLAAMSWRWQRHIVKLPCAV